MPGGTARRVVLTSAVTALGVAGAVFASPSNAAPALPKLSESCPIPPFASVHYAIQNGHAVSGTWTLAPRINCDTGKTWMTITVTLKRNGAPQLFSTGTCHRKAFKLCTTAAGPRRTKSYSTSIRGSWTASVHYSLGGPDAILFARSSSSTGTCKYDVAKTAAICDYNTAPIVIR